MDAINYMMPQRKSRLYLDMMSSQDPTYVYMIQRFPRLHACMQWCGIMSDSEVGAALRDYVYARDGFVPADMLKYGGGEACQHYGGPLKLIKNAIRAHHSATLREQLYAGKLMMLGH